MPEYLSPGVYVEEVSTGPRPIEGVSTSTAGFVGQTERGPEYPLMVTSWSEYQHWFGSYMDPSISYLPYAVQGFFDNGGQRLFIARVAPGVGKAANMTVPGRAQAKVGDLTLQAIGRGDWGNRIYYAVEEASKAKTAQAESPVKKWIKVTLIYFSRVPLRRRVQLFSGIDTAQTLTATAKEATEAAEAAAQAASTAIAALTNASTDAERASAKALAVKALPASASAKEATQALLDEITQFAAGLETTLSLNQDNDKLKDVQTPLDQVIANVSQANQNAIKAEELAVASANAQPLSAQAASDALAPAQKARDLIKNNDQDLFADVHTKTSLAFPSQAALISAQDLAGALALLKSTADRGKRAIAAFEGDGANADKKKAAILAATQIKTAVQDVVTKSGTMKTAAAAEKTDADADAAADPADTTLNAIKVQAATASGRADTLTDAVASPIKSLGDAGTALTNTDAAPPTSVLVKAILDAMPAVETGVQGVVDAEQETYNLYQSTQPVLLAVNPMIQANRLQPGFRTPDLVEVYDNLRISAGASNSLVVSLGGASQLVVPMLNGSNVPLSQTETGPNGEPIVVFSALQGGSASADNRGIPITVPALADFTGTVDPIDSPDGKSAPFGTGTGLAGLATIEGISLLAAPDESMVGSLSEAVINQCELLRDRFAVVSAPNGKSNFALLNPTQDTTFAAFYYPWIWVFDPVSNGPILIPPTGHVTGLIARTDIERGVHKAPANEVLRDAVDLEFPIPKGKQDILNPKGVNCVRDFRPQGRSIRLWGARTMTSDPEWKYINVRRLFIFVEQSIFRGTQWVVFEPNDDLLWAKVRLSISAFLTAVWKSGALMGTTQDEAFFVRCDRTTMTQNDIDNGRLVCLIGIAPVKPAEFVIFRISQKMQEVAE